MIDIRQGYNSYLRVRFLPNNQLLLTRTSKKPSRKKETDSDSVRATERRARILYQLQELSAADELIGMIGLYCVELIVGTYKRDDESDRAYAERHDRFTKDPLYKPVISYEDESVERYEFFLETDRQCERRLRERCNFFGLEYKGFSESDKIRLDRFHGLPRRNGYIWQNAVLHKEQVDEIRGKLARLLHPESTHLDIPDDFQEESTESISPKTPASKNSKKELGADNKPTRFSYKAQRAMHCCGYVFDKLCSLEDSAPNAYFTTLTLPGGTAEAIRQLAAWSGYLQNRLMQVIRDFEQKYDIELHWLKSWEWQKRGALHLHLVLGSDPSVPSDIIFACSVAMRNLWYRLLKDFLDLPLEKREIKYGGKIGNLPVVDMFERADSDFFKIKTWREHPEKWQDKIVKVEKSVGRYLAKYTGKSKDFDKKKDTVLYYPSRWWGSSRFLSQETKRLTIDESLELPVHAHYAFCNFVDNVREGIKATPAVESEFVVLYSGKILIKGSVGYDIFMSNPDVLPTCLLTGQSSSEFSTVDLEDARFIVYSSLARLISSLKYLRDRY